MFNKYYQDELAYLRDMGREYAALHPESAGWLLGFRMRQDADLPLPLDGYRCQLSNALGRQIEENSSAYGWRVALVPSQPMESSVFCEFGERLDVQFILMEQIQFRRS